MRLGLIVSLTTCLATGTAEIVDRIAVIVDNQAIKQSDIDTETRVTDFLNGAKLDLGIAAQKDAASRLIDQKVIRKAMENGVYPSPAPEEAETLVKQLKQRYSNEASYRRALTSYGIDEATLRQHLLWQIAVLRFISLRFPPTGAGGQAAAADGQAPADEPGGEANQQFFAWLNQSRKDARIVFKREDLK